MRLLGVDALRTAGCATNISKDSNSLLWRSTAAHEQRQRTVVPRLYLLATVLVHNHLLGVLLSKIRGSIEAETTVGGRVVSVQTTSFLQTDETSSVYTLLLGVIPDASLMPQIQSRKYDSEDPHSSSEKDEEFLQLGLAVEEWQEHKRCKGQC